MRHNSPVDGERKPWQSKRLLGQRLRFNLKLPVMEPIKEKNNGSSWTLSFQLDPKLLSLIMSDPIKLIKYRPNIRRNISIYRFEIIEIDIASTDLWISLGTALLFATKSFAHAKQPVIT